MEARQCASRTRRSSVCLIIPPGIRVRRPFSEAAVVRVTSVSSSSRKLARSEQIWGPGPGCVVVNVRTDAGLIEAGVERQHVEWLIARLAPTNDDRPDNQVSAPTAALSVEADWAL